MQNNVLYLYLELLISLEKKRQQPTTDVRSDMNVFKMALLDIMSISCSFMDFFHREWQTITHFQEVLDSPKEFIAQMPLLEFNELLTMSCQVACNHQVLDLELVL